MKGSKSFAVVACLMALVVSTGLRISINAQDQQADKRNLFIVYKNGKWGYSNRNGEIVIKPQFKAALLFDNGWAEVWHKDQTERMLIDASGHTVMSSNFAANHFSEGLIPVKIENKYGFANLKGELTIFPIFDDAGDFADGLAPVQIGDKWGYIERGGKVVIAPQFDGAASFSEGLAAIGFTNTSPQNDGKERESFPLPRNWKYGFINRGGEIVIKPQFADAGIFADGLAPVMLPDKSNEPALFRHPANEKWGYIDKTGKVVIDYQFSPASNFAEGLAAVKIGPKWGYIDTQGRTVIAPQFEHAAEFNDGLAFVGKGKTKIDFPYRGLTIMRIKLIGREGYIDRTGKFVSDKLSWESK